MAITQERTPPQQQIDMGDLAPYPTSRSIASIGYGSDAVTVRWDDEQTSTFDAIWLRDNCPCIDCRHPQTMERTFQLLNETHPVIIDRATLAEAGGLRVDFAGSSRTSHRSQFDAGWLRHHCYSDWARRERTARRTLWGDELAGNIPTFTHGEIMKDDESLKRWLESLLDKGLTIVRSAPALDGEVRRIAERVGVVRDTNFGSVFDVESKPKPNNTAYTASGLEPHTDMPNVAHPPDFQLLLCITNEARGGGSIFVDGFRVAEEFRTADPKGFEVLSQEPIEFRFHDETCDLRHVAPVIALDRDGRVSEIRFSNWLRTAPALTQGRTVVFYEALLRFSRLLQDARFQIRPRLAPGEMVAFDNRRILHGRESFDPNTGRRHLQGCYLDREKLESRLRIIARRG